MQSASLMSLAPTRCMFCHRNLLLCAVTRVGCQSGLTEEKCKAAHITFESCGRGCHEWGCYRLSALGSVQHGLHLGKAHRTCWPKHSQPSQGEHREQPQPSESLQPAPTHTVYITYNSVAGSCIDVAPRLPATRRNVTIHRHMPLTSKRLLQILRALDGVVLGAAETSSFSDDELPEDGTADSGFLSP